MTAPVTDTLPVSGYRTGTWLIDAGHSEVGFSVRHMMVSKVRGRFTEFSGTIITAQDVTRSTAQVDIQLGSIETGSEQRDGHLRSPDFFATDEHPTMTYRSTGLTAHGDDWQLEGELTLKGVTKSVPVAFEFNGANADAFGGYRMGFSGTAQINREDFGVTWNQAIEGGGVVVSDKVTIQLEIEAVLQD